MVHRRGHEGNRNCCAKVSPVQVQHNQLGSPGRADSDPELVRARVVTVGSLSGSDFFNGDMVSVGNKNAEWNDATIEANLSPTSWTTWTAAGFSWLVGFQTISTVTDATGGGGNETARTAISLVSDPAGWSWGAVPVMARPFNPIPFL